MLHHPQKHIPLHDYNTLQQKNWFSGLVAPSPSSPHVRVRQDGKNYENCLWIQKQPSVLIAALKIL